MLLLPQKGRGLFQHNLGTVGAGSPGTSVTTGGSASTKGSVVEIFSSTLFDANEIYIAAEGYGAATTACQGSLDILIGPSTEEVLIPDLLMGYCGLWDNNAAQGSTGIKNWKFPLYIPAGSRISARAAGARTSTAFRVHLGLKFNPSLQKVGRKVITYGIGTVPDGVTIVPGASGAEGSWTEIVASTGEGHFALFPSFQPSGDSSLVGETILVDLGIGAATEEEIAQSYAYLLGQSERMSGPSFPEPTYADIPSGSRLAMRASNSTTNDSSYNGVIHAVS